MKLSQPLYQYLVAQKVFEPTKQANKNPVILTETQGNLVENGIAVAKLLKSIYQLKSNGLQRYHTTIYKIRPITPLMQLDSLKQITTASTKLYNWNIIIQALAALQIPNEINSDIKKLILMGDEQIIEEQIHYLFDYYLRLNQSNQVSSQRKSSPLQRSRILSENQQINYEQNSNILEFFTHILSKQLNLQVKQVVSLYAENFKYWAQIVTKGVQRVYEPIIGFYKDVFISVEHLLNLITMDRDKGLKFSLSLLKPGLVSKSQEVATESIRCLGKFVIQAHNQHLSILEDIYKWYADNCLQTTLLSIKRHPALVDSLVDLMLLFCRNHLVELFTKVLKQHSGNLVEMLMTIEKLYNSLTGEYLLEIHSMGILKSWLDQSLGCLESENLKCDERIGIMRLVCSIWKKYNEEFSRDSGRVHAQLKQMALDQNQVIGLFGALMLFQLLELFGENKVNEAPTLYKIIALVVVECRDDCVLHFLLNNLLGIFQTLPSIPLSIVLDPFIQAQQDQSYPSLIVFNFFNQIASNPNLIVKSQLQLMDLMSKIAIYDTIHYKIALGILMQIVNKTQQSSSTEEFILKFIKISLAVYYSVNRKQANSTKKPQQIIVDKQRKAQIIEVLKSITSLNNQNLNEIVKMMAGHTNLQFKLINKTNKGLNSLLSQFGDVSQIMAKVEKEYNEQQSQKQNYSESSVLEVKQVQNSVKKYSKIKLSKEEQYHLARLRMSKEADPKVLEDIQSIKKQLRDKQEQQTLQQKEKELHLKNQKERLRNQLEKRQIEQGVSTLNKKDMIVRLIFPDGSRQSELIKEKKHGLTIYELLDLNYEEDIDKLLVDQLLKKYHKAMRYIFTKYANSSDRIFQPDSFQQMKQKTEVITIAELIKFVHDYEINITNENVQSLSRQVGVQLLHTKNDFKEFDFLGFQHFIVQLGIILNQKQISIQPYQCLQYLINHFRTITATKNQNVSLYDDPDTQYFMDNDIIKEFNQRLIEDPEYKLPEAYQKIPTKVITFNYKINFIPDEEYIPYSIINDILKDSLGINMIEPISSQEIMYKAKPNAFGYISSKLQQEPKDEMFTIKHKITKETNHQEVRKKVLEIEPKRDLSLNMKLGLAEFNYRDRAIAEQVVNLLDDMIFAVEHNKLNLKRQTQIINKVIEEKKLQQNQISETEQMKEQKRKDRERELKLKLEQQKEMMKQRVLSEEKERIQKSKTETSKNKAEQEKKHKYLSELRSKIQTNQERQKEEQLRKILEEKEKNEKEFKQKKEKFKEFNLQQISKLKKIIQNDQKSKQINLKQQSDKIKQQQLQLQQARSKILTQDQSRVQQEKTLEKEINLKFKEKQYQDIFEKYAFGLSYLFQFLIKETYYSIGKPSSREQITYKTFAWFCDRFNICPETVSKETIIIIYRILTKEKEVIDNIPIGMNFEEFLMSLHRIAIKASAIFNKVVLKSKSIKMDIQDIQKIVEAEQIVTSKIEAPLSQSPRAISVIEGTPVRNKSKSFLENSMALQELQVNFQQTNENTLEALILYLDISNDKGQLDQRFRKVLEDKKVPTKIRKQNLQEKLGINQKQ